jgi:hypothetical protein
MKKELFVCYLPKHLFKNYCECALSFPDIANIACVSYEGRYYIFPAENAEIKSVTARFYELTKKIIKPTTRISCQKTSNILNHIIKNIPFEAQ